MGVSAANAKSRHPCHAGAPVRRPVFKFGIDKKRTPLEVNNRVGRFKVKTGGNLLVFQSQYGFNRAGHPRCRNQVPHVALHGTDRAVAFFIGLSLKSLGEGSDFYRISQLRRGTVGFYIRNRLGRNPGNSHGLRDNCSLTANRRRGKTDFPRTIVINSRALDNRSNWVSFL